MVRIWLTNTDYLTCIINVNLSKAKYCCEWSPWVSIDLIASFLCYPDERILRSEWSVSPASPATAHVQSMSSLGQSSQSPQSWQATVPCRFASLSERRAAGTEASRRGQVWREVSVGLLVVSEWCGPQPAPASLEWCQYWPAGSSDIIQLLHWLCLYMMIQ